MNWQLSPQVVTFFHTAVGSRIFQLQILKSIAAVLFFWPTSKKIVFKNENETPHLKNMFASKNAAFPITTSQPIFCKAANLFGGSHGKMVIQLDGPWLRFDQFYVVFAAPSTCKMPLFTSYK